MSEPTMPDRATRVLLISHLLHGDCACDMPHNKNSKQKCSRCTILDALRFCWPTEYLSVADVMLRKAQGA